MSRSEDDDKLDRIAKYKIFKRAFDTVSFFVESGNIVGGFVLSFSILEDRMKAAMVDCFKAIGEPIGSDEISKIPYGKVVLELFLTASSITSFLLFIGETTPPPSGEVGRGLLVV